MKSNSLTIPIVSPRLISISPLQRFNFMTLDYAIHKIDDNQNYKIADVMSKTLYISNYDNKKFKIRAPVQSVKTTRIRNYEPFQRIKKVQELIKRQKQYQQILQESQNKKQMVLTELSPKNKILQKLIEKDNIFKINRNASYKKKNYGKQFQALKNEQRISQIQTVIKKIKRDRQSHVKEIRLDTAVVPKRQKKLKIQNIQFDSINLNLKQNQFSQRLKNTKKLNQRSRNKKKCNNYSLLSRINKLNQYQQSFMHFQPAYNNNRGSLQLPNSQNFS